MGLFLIILFTLISIVCHEAGHYMAGRRYGVIATEFNVGLGPKLYGFNKAGTDWNIRLFPVGGSCVYGDQNDIEIANLKVTQRMWTFFAGPFVNLVLGLIGFVVWKGCNGNLGFDVLFEYLKTVIELVPSLIKSLAGIFDPTRTTLAGTGSWVDAEFAGLNTIKTIGFAGGLFYALNVALFIFNILPIPALDGGQIALAIPELFGRPISDKTKNALNGACFIILMGVSVIYLVQDMLIELYHSLGF